MTDYFELCELVEKTLPRQQSFAPAAYWLKMAVILGSAVGLEIYIHTTRQYEWYLTSTMGLLMALIGLNIQHDANHGALSRNPAVNRLLGMTQNYIGGSRIDWIHQHVVQHHISTNDLHDDPDLSGNDLLRLNPIKPLLRFHVFQYIYAFIVIAGFGLAVTIGTLKNILAWKNYTAISGKLQNLKLFELGTSVLFFFRWVVLPMLLKPSLHTALSVLPLFVVCGYYLAFFFIISHNFSGVQCFDKNTTEKSFLYRQVRRTCCLYIICDQHVLG